MDVSTFGPLAVCCMLDSTLRGKWEGRCPIHMSRDMSTAGDFGSWRLLPREPKRILKI